MLSPSILTETEGERESPQHLRLPPIKTLRVEAPAKGSPLPRASRDRRASSLRPRESCHLLTGVSFGECHGKMWDRAVPRAHIPERCRGCRSAGARGDLARYTAEDSKCTRGRLWGARPARGRRSPLRSEPAHTCTHCTCTCTHCTHMHTPHTPHTHIHIPHAPRTHRTRTHTARTTHTHMHTPHTLHTHIHIPHAPHTVALVTSPMGSTSANGRGRLMVLIFPRGAGAHRKTDVLFRNMTSSYLARSLGRFSEQGRGDASSSTAGRPGHLQLFRYK